MPSTIMQTIFIRDLRDIAWDVAGFGAEFGIPDKVLADWASSLGDPGLPIRLPFYRVAYLAFRLGYTTARRRDPWAFAGWAPHGPPRRPLSLGPPAGAPQALSHIGTPPKAMRSAQTQRWETDP